MKYLISSSCDSLSNLYLWHIKYSYKALVRYRTRVVIRFQICIFDILNTARKNGRDRRTGCDSLSNLYLWHIKYSAVNDQDFHWVVVIRFQICIFDILNTAIRNIGLIARSCDSLSNLYLWHIKYSTTSSPAFNWTVVIRFQICIFDILNTAWQQNIWAIKKLWFAFKFVSLTY